jgi:uncharacterized protein Smg (DUF494 family)
MNACSQFVTFGFMLFLVNINIISTRGSCQGIIVIQQLMSREISSLHQDETIVKSVICYMERKAKNGNKKNIILFVLQFSSITSQVHLNTPP